MDGYAHVGQLLQAKPDRVGARGEIPTMFHLWRRIRHTLPCALLFSSACGSENGEPSGGPHGHAGSSGLAGKAGRGNAGEGAGGRGGADHGSAGSQVAGTAGSTGSGGASQGGSSGAGVSGGASNGGQAGRAGTSAGGGMGGSDSTQAGTYYVSPDGDDSNPGTLSAPFLTLQKARDVVRSVNAGMNGDISVYLRGGTYRMSGPVTFGPEDSGRNGYHVRYLAAAGEAPILNGATRVTGWTPHTANLYKAPLNRTVKLRNLYVNDTRAQMASRTAVSRGGEGTHSITAGQADWAWRSGSGPDGVKYSPSDIPNIAKNKDDLEIVNGTTWNENIACVRDVVTTADNSRALLLQQPYGLIAQLPGWDAGFKVTGTHTIYNAFEFLDSPGEFYFDKSEGTLYYYPRAGEDMNSAEVEAPVAERLVDLVGTSTADRVRNITFEGITFANTDYHLAAVGGSHGKASVQAATVYVAYGDGNWHNEKYRILDTLPGVINVESADSIRFLRNVVKHSGAEGIVLKNDVNAAELVGNRIADTAGSGITIGHPQHIYVGDGGEQEKYGPGAEGVCTDISINNNVLLSTSSVRGFGGHSGITAFFVDGLKVTNNLIQGTAYNGISLGWGWRNFKDSTTCKDNVISRNRFIDTLSRLHDSGAIYTIGQMPGTQINENYVRGIPPATNGPTYGLHNDEGTAYITENDNVLDIDPGVKYTINCEDFGEKHHLTILRTYATVNKMGVNPPDSMIDPPVVVLDNVWPLPQYEVALRSGVEDEFRDVVPTGALSLQDYVFPASCEVESGTAAIPIRSSGVVTNSVWFAPDGTSQFVVGDDMTRASGTDRTIAVPSRPGTYKLHILDADGTKLGESQAILRVE